jgi:hypothetical protein
VGGGRQAAAEGVELGGRHGAAGGLGR